MKTKGRVSPKKLRARSAGKPKAPKQPTAAYFRWQAAEGKATVPKQAG